MAARKEITKIVVNPHRGGAIQFHADAYCSKHVTSDGKPCPVHWEIHAETDFVIVRWLADTNNAEEVVGHGLVERMVRGVSATPRAEAKISGND